MPRVTFVKKAQKNVKGSDIKKGESYYWWKFRRGGKHTSRKPPKPSQLTQSAFWGTVYQIQEGMSRPDFDSLESTIEDLASQLEDLRDETQGSLDNMPEGLQQGDTGQLLQERIDALEEATSTLESITINDDFEGKEGDALDKAKEERAEEVWSEVEAALDLSCS